MSAPTTGRVVSLAVRPAKNATMRELTSVVATQDGGFSGDVSSPPDRGMTLISSEQWRDVVKELGVALPWYTRRANVLVEGLVMADLIGRELTIGDVRVQIVAETKPCGLMDKQHQGLRKVLEPQCRGGVYGRIVAGGEIRVGDEINLLA